MAERDAKGRYVAVPRLPMRVELLVRPGRADGKVSELRETGWFLEVVRRRQVQMPDGHYLGTTDRFWAEALVVRASGRLAVWPVDRLRWTP
jgi:hypothetical protein